MKDNEFVTVKAFMRNQLGLKGHELLVYAVIYGFTQDGEHWYHGTKGYLADWCGATKATVGNCLKGMVESGILERREHEERGQVFVEYRANLERVYGGQKNNPPLQNFDPPHTKIDPINKIDKRIDKEERKKEGAESYDEIVRAYTDSEELREDVMEWVKMRRLIKKPLTNRALKMALAKLDGIAQDIDARRAVVQQSVVNCWQSFYPVKESKAEARAADYSEYDFDQPVRGARW